MSTLTDAQNKIEYQITAQRVVTQELRRRFSYVQPKGGSVWIRCPLPTHGKADSTPSMKFNLNPDAPVALGFCYCFGCGAKMPWNAFAEKHGLKTLRQTDMERTNASGVGNRIRKIYARSTETADTMEGIVDQSWGVKALHDVQSDWRGIPEKLLKRVGAKIGIEKISTPEGPSDEMFLYLPVNVNGATVGVVKARMEKVPRQTSYFNSDGTWAKRQGLFLFDYVKQQLQKWDLKTVILSEGPRDGLNGLAHKLPVISILGVKQWTESKRNLILSLGIDNVILAFDGDIHGVRATKRIYEDLEPYINVDFVAVRNYNTTDDEGKEHAADLGEAPQGLIDELTDMVYNAK